MHAKTSQSRIKPSKDASVLEKTRKSIKEKETIERSSIFLAFSHFPSTVKTKYMHWNPFLKKKHDNHVFTQTLNFESDVKNTEQVKLDLSNRPLKKSLNQIKCSVSFSIPNANKEGIPPVPSTIISSDENP